MYYSSSYATGFSIGYIIGGLAVCIILGFVTKHINESKGYEGGFAWGFWLNVIGVIVVACKPENRNPQKKTSNEPPVSDAYVQDRIKFANQEYASREYESARTAYQTILKFYAHTLDESTIADIGAKIKECSKVLNGFSSEDDNGAEMVKCPNCGLMTNKNKANCYACTKPLFEEKPIVENTIQEQPIPKAPIQKVSTSNESIALIKQLAELHSQGILSDEEFEKKKAELLAKV